MSAGKALVLTTIHEVIDQVCAEVNKKTSEWQLSRSGDKDYDSPADMDPSLLFGVSARLNDGTACALATFYVAYSTWDGRMLYLDRIKTEDCPVTLTLLLRQTLAKIAVNLGCSRFTWQHYSEPAIYPVDHAPETLHGWLTMYWKPEEMKNFLGKEPPLLDTSRNDSQKVISKLLKNQTHANFTLKLAEEKDVDDIGSLVQGLADYEKEPDAVHVTVDQYRLDGFGEKPLYFCVLVDYEDGKGATKTVGMAFCYVGFKTTEGRFVYLEDLFIEEAYRGQGVGSFVMRALASIGLGLGCSRLIWQALEWDPQARSFYKKIGAEEQDGLLTTRFTDKALVDFSNADLL